MFLFGSGMASAAAAAGARSEAANARAAANRSKRGVSEMETRLDRALLACEAMWSLMRDKLGVTDEELLARINDIDLSDGKLDGKVRKTPVACPKCSRTIPSRLPQCMYCGQPILNDPFA